MPGPVVEERAMAGTPAAQRSLLGPGHKVSAAILALLRPRLLGNRSPHPATVPGEDSGACHAPLA